MIIIILMVDLTRTLQGNDLVFLRMVANAWGIELSAPDAFSALPILVNSILNPSLVQEVMESLPAEAKEAIRKLIEHQGQLPWSVFTRRFGEVRVMGASRRDRERPDLSPSSPAEVLWYRAIIGRAFLNIPPESQEYAYIPDDLLELLQPWGNDERKILGRPASPQEKVHIQPVNDRILDHICTLLAALRSDIPLENLISERWSSLYPFLRQFSYSYGLISIENLPAPDSIRAFLETSRTDTLATMVRHWMSSEMINELVLIPGLRIEGTYENNSLRTRQNILEMLSELPQDTWWSLSSFIAAVKEHKPDFQRTAGEYESWHIYSKEKNDYLRGFVYWDDVEGALLRFLISGPLHWLGLMEIAGGTSQTEVTAFRLSPWAKNLWHGSGPDKLAEENQPIRAFSEGLLILSRFTPRTVRYQVSRFVEWEEEAEDEYHYRLTTTSMERAAKQGLRATHLLALLKRHGAKPLPPSLLKSLERWEKFGSEASLKRSTLLKVVNPEVISALRKSPAGRYLGEALNPHTIILKPGGEEAVRNALAGLGFLTEIHEKNDS